MRPPVAHRGYFLEESVVTKTRNRFIAVAVVAALSLFVPAQAQQSAEANREVLGKYFEAIGSDLSARRDSAMSTLIEMNEQEKKAFWPLKKNYDQELKAIFNARFELISDFDKIHDKLNAENAARIAERAFEIDAQRSALHRKYFEQMSKQISPVIAVQFLQLQGQFETMADMKLASQVPLAVK